MDSKHTLIVSAVIFVVLLVLAFFAGDFVIASNLIFLGIVILTVPFSLQKFLEFKKIRTYEDQFPNFLRDLAESQRAGLTLMQAIQTAAKTEYGMLSHEVKHMHNQLTWNVPLEVVLKNATKRMKKSIVIVRALNIIDQSTKSGGDVERTMESLASNIEQLKEVQEEKSALLNQQVIMMYAIFFVFLGISITLIKFLVPLLQTQAETGGFGFQGFSANPCSQCIGSGDPSCLGCHTFTAISAGFDFGEPESADAYYKGLFFTMIIVQGFFSGLIAGQIGADKVAAGVKHSIIMVLVGVVAFMISTRVGFI